jgi:hypothetical protein
MTHDKTWAVLAATVGLLAAAPSRSGADAPGDDRMIPVTATYTGLCDDVKKLEVAPQSFRPGRYHLTSADELEAIWKSWRPTEAAPKLDLAKVVVCVLAAEAADPPDIVPRIDRDGNVSLYNGAMKQARPGFGYRVTVIPRAGVKTVSGVRLE